MSPQISGMTSTLFCPRNIDQYCRCKVDVFYKVLLVFIVRLPQCLNNTSKFAILNAAEKCNTSSGMLPPISTREKGNFAGGMSRPYDVE